MAVCFDIDEGIDVDVGEFFGKVRKSCLEKYFHDRGLLLDTDFKKLETKAIYDQWLKLPRWTRLDTKFDFLEIQRMASGPWLNDFMATHGEQWIKHGSYQSDDVEQSLSENFHFFIRRPEYWRAAVSFRISVLYDHGINNQHTHFHADTYQLEQLAEIIDRYIDKLASRGKDCKVYCYQGTTSERFICFFDEENRQSDCLLLEVFIPPASGRSIEFGEPGPLVEESVGSKALRYNSQPGQFTRKPIKVGTSTFFVREFYHIPETPIDNIHRLAHEFSRNHGNKIYRVMEGENTPKQKNIVGRKQKPYWKAVEVEFERLWNVHGEEKSQADYSKLLLEWFDDPDKEPGFSSMKRHVRIWMDRISS